MSRKVEVKVLSRNFSFEVNDEIDERSFMELVDYVQKIFLDIKGSINDIDDYGVAVLGSFNIAEQFFKYKKISEESLGLLERIDSSITLSESQNEKEGNLINFS